MRNSREILRKVYFKTLLTPLGIMRMITIGRNTMTSYGSCVHFPAWIVYFGIWFPIVTTTGKQKQCILFRTVRDMYRCPMDCIPENI